MVWQIIKSVFFQVNQYNVQMWTCSMWILVQKGNKSSLISLISDACSQQEGSRVNEWMNLGQPLVEVRPKWTFGGWPGSSASWPILPPTAQQTDLPNRSNLGCFQQRAMGVGLKDHGSSFLADNSSSFQKSARNPNKTRSKTCAAVYSAHVSAARPQASAAHRGRSDLLSRRRTAGSSVSSARAVLLDALVCGPWHTCRTIYLIYYSLPEHLTPPMHFWFNVISKAMDHWVGLGNKTCI